MTKDDICRLHISFLRIQVRCSSLQEIIFLTKEHKMITNKWCGYKDRNKRHSKSLNITVFDSIWVDWQLEMNVYVPPRFVIKQCIKCIFYVIYWVLVSKLLSVGTWFWLLCNGHPFPDLHFVSSKIQHTLSLKSF